MKANCKNCGRWFPISRELEELIQDGIIYAPEVNLCPDCAEIEAERAEWEENLKQLLSEI